MKKHVFGLLAGVAMLSVSSPAFGQGVVPGSPVSSPQRELGRSINDYILVDGSPAEAAASQTLTPGGQMWQQGRQQTRISRPDWRRSGRPEAEFDRILGINQQMCVRMYVRILRYGDLAVTFQRLTGLANPLADRYISMAGRIRTAAGVRQAMGLLQSGLGFLTGSLATGGTAGITYGGSVTAGAVGNEMQGQVHDESMLLSRDHGVYNLVATVANIEANLLSAEANIDYWDFIDRGYCRDAVGRMQR